MNINIDKKKLLKISAIALCAALILQIAVLITSGIIIVVTKTKYDAAKSEFTLVSEKIEEVKKETEKLQ